VNEHFVRDGVVVRAGEGHPAQSSGCWDRLGSARSWSHPRLARCRHRARVFLACFVVKLNLEPLFQPCRWE